MGKASRKRGADRSTAMPSERDEARRARRRARKAQCRAFRYGSCSDPLVIPTSRCGSWEQIGTGRRQRPALLGSTTWRGELTVSMRRLGSCLAVSS